MKKIFFLTDIVILILIAANLIAQTPVDIGLKAGISIPNLTAGNSSNPISSGYSSRLDVAAAIYAEFHLSKHFSLQPQLEYSSQGGKKKGVQAFTVPAEMEPLFPPGQAPSYLYANYRSVAKMNYLMLPVLAKLHLNTGKKWGTYFSVGPFISYLLSAKNITSGSSIIYLDKQQTQPLSNESQSFDNTENVRSDLHKFNSGISGEAGINYKLSKGRIFFEAGGNFGLLNIQKDGRNGKNKSGAAVITAGYQFFF